MRFVWYLVAAILLLAPSAVQAEIFSSREYGFEANFPGTAKATPPENSEMKTDGTALSQAVSFDDMQMGVYFTTVTVDRYIVPVKLNVQETLTSEMDGLVKSVGGTGLSSSFFTYQKSPAVQFTFEVPQKKMQVQGLVLVREDEEPTVYIVTACSYEHHTAESDAALDTFMHSFRLK